MSILTTAAAVRVREALGAGIGILAAACVAFAVSRDLWLTVYLIGGGAMSLRDLKGATKDIDLVVPDGDAYGQLWAVLMDLGYAEVQSLDPDYWALGATSCVENDDGIVERFVGVTQASDVPHVLLGKTAPVTCFGVPYVK